MAERPRQFNTGDWGRLQLNRRLKPELSFTLGCLDVNMHTRLFAGEEIEAKPTFAKDCRAHPSRL